MLQNEKSTNKGYEVNSRKSYLIMLGLFVVTVAIYIQAAYFPFFVLDDADYVTNNSHVVSGLSFDSITWAFTAFHSGNWHPVTWISLMLDSHLFGNNPAGFHVVNVVLHAISAALLMLLLNVMTGAVWRSAFVAACFALHPLHVESVAWVAERKDVLSALFLILTLLCYSFYVTRGRLSMYVFSVIAFAFGLMAKPMLVSTPILLLLLDYWPFRRLSIRLPSGSNVKDMQPQVRNGRTVRQLVLEKIPFVLLSAGSSIVTLYAQQPSISKLANVPFPDRVSNAFWTLLLYMIKMVFPIDLAVIYPLVSLPAWKVSSAAGAVCVLSFLVIKYADAYRYYFVGWFWYLITLLPVIGLVQVGKQSMADRYTYIPFIGLFIMASWGATEICYSSPKLKKAISAAAVVFLLMLSLTTWRQLGYWRNNKDLIKHSLEVTENNHFAYYSLGLVYQQLGNNEQAISEFKRSIDIEPRDPIVQFDLAFLLDTQGKELDAITHFNEAIALDPNFAQAHFNLGLVLGKLGAINESIGKLNDAVRIEPNNPKFRNNLGVTLAQQGMLDEAIQQFNIVLQLNPGDEKAKGNLQIAVQQKSLK